MPQLFPTFNAAAIVPAVSSPAAAIPNIAWGVAPLFDFDSNKFLISDSGDLVLGNEATTLSQRITSILLTPRLTYKIHGANFGSYLTTLFGSNYPVDILKSLGQRYVKDAIIDTRIIAVKSLVSDVQNHHLIVSFAIVTVGGFDQQFEGKWRV